MGKLIGVQFQKNGKLYYFDANDFDVKPGDYVIVDTARGYDLGEVALGPRDTDEESWRSPLKKTIRIATEQDIQHSVENRQKEKEAFSICQKKIAEHKLEMKLVSVEYAFDNSKILFFFTANGRVDFRSLVKDLASIFKMRIELRQIGVRDEAKMLGGLGPCGRPICCGTFLDQFQPVSIKMAKEQNLSLNPTKISGVCGRLMCCLKYEQEHYEMTRKKMPKIGREVSTPDGNGPVTDLNIVKETVFVRLTNGDTSEIKEYSLEQIVRPQEIQQTRQEASRKQNETKEKTEDNEEDKKLSSQEPDISDNQTDMKKDEHPETGRNAGQDSSDNWKNRNRNRTNRNVLGQPVKRENPRRTDSNNPPRSDEKNLKKADSPVTAGTDIKKAPSSGGTKNSWADALEKAMQAISQDK